MHQRILIRDGLVAAFARRPEVYAVYAFGSDVDGQSDYFSDVDLTVSSQDVGATCSALPQIVGSVCSVRKDLLLYRDETYLARAFMFEGVSPYLKADLAISESRSHRSHFGPFQLLWGKDLLLQSSTDVPAVVPSPPHVHLVEDTFFASSRFTKALRRQQSYAYVRWYDLVSKVSVLLYEQLFGWETGHPRARLNSRQHHELETHLPLEHLELYHAAFPLSGMLALGDSFNRCLVGFAALARNKAQAVGVQLDECFIDDILRFVDQEVTDHKAAGET